MSRIDFGWFFLKMSKNCFCLCSCMRGLKFAYIAYIYAYVALFLCTQVCSWGSTYLGMNFHTRGLVHARGPWLAYMRRLAEALLCLFYSFFTRFTSLWNFNTYFCHFFIWASLHHSFYLHSCITIPYSSNFTWIMNLMASFFLQSSSPYASKGSTNKVVEWFNLFAPKTKKLLCVLSSMHS